MSKLVTKSLNDWVFTQVGGGQGTKDGEWIKTSSFPTTVHVELLKLKKIPDPFVGLHEWDVQWIGECEWSFKTTFGVSEEELASPNADAVFDGLDTFSSVYLNGTKILDTKNQFLSYRAGVKSLLLAENELVINFESAFKNGRIAERDHGGPRKLWNGDSSRLFVRKAGYNYGWDWGPVLMTVGPWKPIKLEFYTNRITDVDIRSDVPESLDVKLSAKFDSLTSEGSGKLTLKSPDGNVKATKDISALGTTELNEVNLEFSNGDVELWYPIGYGKQPLYTAVVQIFDKNGDLLDEVTKKIGFRRARIIEDPLIDQEGRTFLFEINNIRIFCGGSNWIPADSFFTTISNERYKAWLQFLADGNQNMIRVWGGGIYEFDVFYEICDELGLLVWQDFMFGCGQYPAYDEYVASVKEEAEQNVARLRHHPSVVIFAGNNEDYQIAESEGLELDYSDETSDFRETNFPARYIYERTLPEVVGRLSNIHYHRSSPYSGYGLKTTDQQHGDLHQWNVWHGSQQPWHNWDILAGRFVSEFGMEAYPDIRTIDYWVGEDKSERFPQSRVTVNHNKADGFERRLELYLMENFKHAFDMESYVYYTQIMQAETLGCAYRLWRRNWKGKGREYTAGALVWQIDDCWPTTSWAIVDYFLRPKPAYFAIARELRPYTVGMTRKEKTTYPDPLSAADFTIETILEIWGTNSELQDKKVILDVTTFDLDSLEQKTVYSEEVTLKSNACTEVFSEQLPGQPVRTKKSEVPKNLVVNARLLDGDTVLARYSNWPEPYKYIKYPPVDDLGFTIDVGSDGESVTLSTKRPIKGIILDVAGEAQGASNVTPVKGDDEKWWAEVASDVKWADQAIDLFPGDPQTIQAGGLRGRKITARFLGDGSA